MNSASDKQNPVETGLIFGLFSILIVFANSILDIRRQILGSKTLLWQWQAEMKELLDVLSRGDDSVLGNNVSYWRRQAMQGLQLITGQAEVPANGSERWEWLRNPLPAKGEDRTFERLRRSLRLADTEPVAPGDRLDQLSRGDRQAINRSFQDLILQHNSYIHRIIRRTRQQLEETIDPETNEPLLERIEVELLGDQERDAVPVSGYLEDAFDRAEEFCQAFGSRMRGAGFLKTLLLRRVGSSIHAGIITQRRCSIAGPTSLTTPNSGPKKMIFTPMMNL